MAVEPRRVTREELYDLVWAKPMSRLAEEFGISGNGLAKICDRLDVPYPPRGYWAKKEAGKPVVTFKLPPLKNGIPKEVDIHPSIPKPAPSPEVAEAVAAAAQKVVGITVPEETDRLHARVTAWIADHKAQQKERDREIRKTRPGSWFTPSPLKDLTDRDLYRFRVASAIFTGIEKAGGKIEASPINGKVTFLISGQKVECSIVEKLVKSLRQHKDQRSWTAYPEHHQGGLESSGYLRVSINTYLGRGKSDWIESEKKTMADLLPDIVGAIMAAGPMLEQQQREHEEWRRQYHEEQQERQEEHDRRELDDKRWERFVEYASYWTEQGRLISFLDQVERRLASEGTTVIGETPVGDWIDWARERIDSLDPFARGASTIFERISKVSR